MGDISRHRDIYLNTRAAIPRPLLARCNLAPEELTYLELGNYFTDVSQFRDPVSYIFAKQKIWRDRILPRVGPSDRAVLARILGSALSAAALAGAAALVATDNEEIGAPLAALAVVPLSVFDNNVLASWANLDDWIDGMLGVPFLSTAGRTRRADRDYGFVGQFFQHFIHGITHLVFAAEIPNKLTGPWSAIDRIPESQVALVYGQFFTQYYPHEHTDQPPYVWDASERHKHPTWYGRSRLRGNAAGTGGIMNAVDQHYIQYAAEELARLEAEWRLMGRNDAAKRHKWLVRLGKILHVVEDWFFHSNVVELTRLRGHRPARRGSESDEQFARRFAQEAVSHPDASELKRLRRRLYRRLRFPTYTRGTRTRSAGIPSDKTSSLNLDHAYPAFPSQQDTSHTLLAALENLEDGDGSGDSVPPWAGCVVKRFFEGSPETAELVYRLGLARGVTRAELATAAASEFRTRSPRIDATIWDVLRELVPLVLTLLNKSERKRLVANVAYMAWPLAAPFPAPDPKQLTDDAKTDELDAQVKRHKVALLTGHADGNNYQRAAKYIEACGHLNPRGTEALVEAFRIDQESQVRGHEINPELPSAGGILIQFAVDLQRAMEVSDAASERLQQRSSSMFDAATDNGAFTEMIGSHSLMSKDTVHSSPFFDDAKVLASVASQTVLHLMLDSVGSPADGKGLHWSTVLRSLIRFPVDTGGWERRALALFQQNRQADPNGGIPKFADIPELVQLARTARVPAAELVRFLEGTKATKLEEEYIKVEKTVSHYRYP